MKRVALALALLGLAGCTMGPNYKRPPIATPDQFRGQQPAAARLPEPRMQRGTWPGPTSPSRRCAIQPGASSSGWAMPVLPSTSSMEPTRT